MYDPAEPASPTDGEPALGEARSACAKFPFRSLVALEPIALAEAPSDEKDLVAEGGGGGGGSPIAGSSLYKLCRVT